MGQVVEPLVYGHGTGLSPIAVILSTVFWTGRLASCSPCRSPCASWCSGAMSRALTFSVLLGDKPALTPAQSFYQRALIGESAEATYQAKISWHSPD
jgi:hypothetical protein